MDCKHWDNVNELEAQEIGYNFILMDFCALIKKYGIEQVLHDLSISNVTIYMKMINYMLCLDTQGGNLDNH